MVRSVLELPRPARPRRTVHVSLLLFGLTTIIYVFSAPRTYFNYDGEIMYRVTESLALRHSIQILDPIWHVNQPYSFYGLAISLFLLPFFALGQLLLHDGRVLINLYQPGMTGLTVVALNLLLVKLGWSWRRSLGISLVFAFGTLAWHYTGELFTEPTLALALTLALLWLLRFRDGNQRRWLVLAGAAVGLTLLTRWDSILLVALPVSLYVLHSIWRARRPARWTGDLLAFGTPVLCALAINLLYDFLRYGNPLDPGYAETLGFSTPLLTGLYGLLLSPGAGLVVYVPVLALAAFGIRRFYGAWPAEALLIGGLLAARLLLYARWWSWDGHDWGPRFLVPLLPLLLLPMAFVPKGRWIKLMAAALVAMSIGIEVLDQLVPDQIYWAHVVPAIASSLHVQQMYDGCPLCSYRAIQAISNVVDFNWRFSPLLWQLKFLVHGAVYPAWRPFAYVMPFILLLAGPGLLLLRRSATRLDQRLTS